MMNASTSSQASKTRRRVLALLVSITVCLSLLFTAQAYAAPSQGVGGNDSATKTARSVEGSWKNTSGSWWYSYSDGSYENSGWKQIDGAWYYFDGAGWMKTGWLKTGGTWYYLTSSGAMATGWQKVGGSWYFLKSSGAMATGWILDGNTWYHCDGSGAMQTGWIKTGGAWYYLTSSGAMKTGWLKQGGTWYYLKDSGAMATGWVLDGNTWYYTNGSGAMQTGWLSTGGKWYYLKGSGAMAIGWQKVGGTWYYLTGSGAMATGWQKVGNVWYYLNSSGAMQANTWVGDYYLQGDGSMATSKWIGNYYVGSDGKWIKGYSGSTGSQGGSNNGSQGDLGGEESSYEAAYARGVQGFFDWFNDWDGKTIKNISFDDFENLCRSQAINAGVDITIGTDYANRNNPGNLDNFDLAIQVMEEVNELRIQNGLDELVFDQRLYALGCVSNQYASNLSVSNPHYVASMLNVGENLAWGGGVSTAINGWYYNEKERWESSGYAKVRQAFNSYSGSFNEKLISLSQQYPNEFNRVGHYLNIINPNYEYTGAAVAYSSSAYTTTYEQSFSSAIHGQVYKVSDLRVAFDTYMDYIKG